MKRSIVFFAAICILITNPVSGQKGGLLKKVANSMTNELLGRPQNNNSNQPEPPCSCNDAEEVVGLGGKIQLDYKELIISTRDDGAILMKDKVSGTYYIANGGVIQGPINAGDKRLAGFDQEGGSDESTDYWIERYGQYITKSGGKYLINFGGKTYGPYATINSFVMPRSNDKFAAMVVENVVTTEDQGKKMDEAMKNAKTDQERMDLALKFSQEMSNKMMQAGGPSAILPKFITSVAGSTYDPMLGQRILNATMKYDEILLVTYPDVFDLKGNKVMTLKSEHSGVPVLFINSGNTKYAYEIYGELGFSDGSPKLNELFNPYLTKVDGKVYLAYMYYSPKKNGIMKCKIPF
jgi:hypothetical protein